MLCVEYCVFIIFYLIFGVFIFYALLYFNLNIPFIYIFFCLGKVSSLILPGVASGTHLAPALCSSLPVRVKKQFPTEVWWFPFFIQSYPPISILSLYKLFLINTEFSSQVLSAYHPFPSL